MKLASIHRYCSRSVNALRSNNYIIEPCRKVLTLMSCPRNTLPRTFIQLITPCNILENQEDIGHPASSYS